MKTSEMVQRLHDMDRLISLQSQYIEMLRVLLGRITEKGTVTVTAKTYYLDKDIDFDFTVESGLLNVSQTDVNLGEYKTILQLKEKLK